VFMSAFKGMTKEHDFAEAFNNAMPFVLLIVIFFTVLAVIETQHLIAPLTDRVFQFNGKLQLMALYAVNGGLSCISDNIFVASVFIKQVETAYQQGLFSQAWYEKLGVVVNMGTNIPAVATPNGHVAFLFLLTSSLAPVLNLSFWQIVKLTLPYTVAMTATGAVCIYLFL